MKNMDRSADCDLISEIDKSKVLASTCKGVILINGLKGEYKEIKKIRSIIPKTS